MNVSVIIPVYNRKERITACLESVLRQAHDDFEVIVIDDASTDGTSQVLDNVKDPRARVIRLTENRGYSYTRNLAVTKAEGKFIVFTDSDCTVAKDWIDELIRPFSNGPLIMITAGKIEDPLKGNYWETVNKGGDFVASKEGYARKAIGCNMAVRKEFLVNNGFDERLSHMAAEDFDLCLRCKKQGHKIFYTPRAKVIHHRRSSLQSTVRQQFYYGYGNAYAYIKNRTFPFVNYGSWILLAAGICLPLGIVFDRLFLIMSVMMAAVYLSLLFCVSLRSGDKAWAEAIRTYPGYLLMSLSNFSGNMFYVLHLVWRKPMMSKG